MNVTKAGKKLVIEMNLQEPKLSSSGRNLVVASSKGPWESAVEIDGKPIVLVVNAWIQADEPVGEGEAQGVMDLDHDEKTTSRRRGRK